MDQTRHLLALLLLIGGLSHKASPQNFRIPNDGDSCNVVNLNFGRGEETQQQARGPQGPQGKRGIPGIMGLKGEKGSRGVAGPIGITPEINAAEIASTVMKALGATSCDELMRIHGLNETGYYLMRSNYSTSPVYTYCDFQLREGIESCQQLLTTLGDDMKSGYFLLNGDDNGRQNFRFCPKVYPKDCKSVNRKDAIMLKDTGGVFDIYPVSEDQNIRVYCDLETDGGGWTVFQRRMDGSVDFDRNWDEYVNDFGEQDGEFWLGLENLHKITNTGDHELRIDLTDWSGNSAYAKYGTFSIGSTSENYRLDVGSFTGTAGDSLTYHDNMQFSTKDADHDPYSSTNCAEYYGGAWWYKTCHNSNLNGYYYRDAGIRGAKGVTWYYWKNSWSVVRSAEMKLRKRP